MAHQVRFDKGSIAPMLYQLAFGEAHPFNQVIQAGFPRVPGGERRHHREVALSLGPLQQVVEFVAPTL